MELINQHMPTVPNQMFLFIFSLFTLYHSKEHPLHETFEGKKRMNGITKVYVEIVGLSTKYQLGQCAHLMTQCIPTVPYFTSPNIKSANLPFVLFRISGMALTSANVQLLHLALTLSNYFPLI